jgi:prepilin-type N-terminal cleavage/methylation domain-containing protein
MSPSRSGKYGFLFSVRVSCASRKPSGLAEFQQGAALPLRGEQRRGTRTSRRSPHPNPLPKGEGPCRAGFTLVELLVASLIGAVLMTGLWTLLRTYERLFTGGEAKIERAQLVRTVLGQFAEDLQSAIADNASSPSGGSAAVRRFGLFGSAQALQVDVLQVLPAQGLYGSLGSQRDRSGRARSPRVPELHTVQWRFETPEEKGRGGSAAWSGLVRRELDWDTPGAGGPGGGASRRGAASGPKGRMARGSGDPESFLRGRFEVEQDDPSILWVPEVVDVDFRYFDGQGWSDQWNSLSRKSLPMAVAVTVRIRTGELTEKVSGTFSGGKPRHLENAGPEKVPDTFSEAEAPTRAHRLLVCLPTTSLARRAEVEAPAAAPPPVVVFRAPPLPSLPAPPAPSGPPPSVNLVRPDQWMRTGQ